MHIEKGWFYADTENYTPQVRLSAKEKAFHQLQRWIVDGTLEPGEKVTDADLAEALGVSRTPVREALQLLESQGFVEMKPGKETKITLIHPDDALAVYPRSHIFRLWRRNWPRRF